MYHAAKAVDPTTRMMNSRIAEAWRNRIRARGTEAGIPRSALRPVRLSFAGRRIGTGAAAGLLPSTRCSVCASLRSSGCSGFRVASGVSLSTFAFSTKPASCSGGAMLGACGLGRQIQVGRVSEQGSPTLASGQGSASDVSAIVNGAQKAGGTFMGEPPVQIRHVSALPGPVGITLAIVRVSLPVQTGDLT